MNKPSILLINLVYPPTRGATGRLLQDLAYALDHSGWNVTILTTGDKTDTDHDKNIKIHRVRSSREYKTVFGYLWTWWRLFFAAVGLPKHDVIITLTDPPMLVVLGRFVAALKKSKHVHWCQDLYPDILKVLNINLPKFLPTICCVYHGGLCKDAIRLLSSDAVWLINSRIRGLISIK